MLRLANRCIRFGNRVVSNDYNGSLSRISDRIIVDLRKNDRIDRERRHVSSFSFPREVRHRFRENERSLLAFLHRSLPRVSRILVSLPSEILSSSWRASSISDTRQRWRTRVGFSKAAATRESESLVRGWKDAFDATQAKAIVQPGSNDLAASTRLITAPRSTNNRRAAATAKSGVPPRHHATDSNVRVARDPMQLRNERYTLRTRIRASFHDRVACSSRERKY